MSLFGVLRTKTLPARRRRHIAVDYNADLAVAPRTGDPRLDLARAMNRAARR